MNRTKSVVALAAGLLLAGVASAAPASAASTSLTATAETGTVTGFGDNLNVSASTSAAHTGTYGYRVDTTAAGGYLNWTATDVEQGHAYASISGLVRVNSHSASESVDLFTIKNNAGVNHFDFFLTPDNHFKYDLLISDNAQLTPTVALGSWHFVQAKVYFGATTYTADVKVDGVAQPSISSTGQTATTARSAWFGTSNAKTHQVDFDDLAFKVGDTDQGYLGGGYTAPSITANCSQLTLRATVNPGGEDTSVFFQYGTTAAFGSTTAAQDIGSGSSGVVASAFITPASSTTYYRAVASSVGGVVNGLTKTEVCS